MNTASHTLPTITKTIRRAQQEYQVKGYDRSPHASPTLSSVYASQNCAMKPAYSRTEPEAALRASVAVVAQDREARGREMHADLMSPVTRFTPPNLT